MSEEIHRGRKFAEGDRVDERAPSPPSMLGGGVAVYAKVVMTGRHGLACSQFQELTFNGLTPAQVDSYKWNYFGVCGAVVTCYDQSGNVISSG